MLTRVEAIKVTGCIPCLLENLSDVYAENHHVVDGSYRNGPDVTYGNCAWHHRGIPWPGLQQEGMETLLGPSLRLSSKRYKARYGSELDLLQTQDFLLVLFDREPWADYAMPRAVAKRVREFWKIVRKRSECTI